MYDLLAGSANMESSYVLGKGKALEAFPMLKAPGLCGAVVYYDGSSSSPILLETKNSANRHGGSFLFSYDQVNTMIRG